MRSIPTTALATATLLALLTRPGAADEARAYVLSTPVEHRYETYDDPGDDRAPNPAGLRRQSRLELARLERAIAALGGRVVRAGLEPGRAGWRDRAAGEEVDRRMPLAYQRDALKRLLRPRYEVRLTGRLSVVFRLGARLPREGPLSAARRLPERTRVELRVCARGPSGDALGAGVVAASWDELIALQARPAATRGTAFGALLRRAWRGALGDRSDDVDAIAASIRVTLGPEVPAAARTFDLARSSTDVVLGRRGTPAERLGDLLGRERRPPPALDEETAWLLERALESAPSPADRRWVLALRRARLGLADEDRAALERLTGPWPGARVSQPRSRPLERRGLAGQLPR